MQDDGAEARQSQGSRVLSFVLADCICLLTASGRELGLHQLGQVEFAAALR